MEPSTVEPSPITNGRMAPYGCGFVGKIVRLPEESLSTAELPDRVAGVPWATAVLPTTREDRRYAAAQIRECSASSAPGRRYAYVGSDGLTAALHLALANYLPFALAPGDLCFVVRQQVAQVARRHGLDMPGYTSPDLDPQRRGEYLAAKDAADCPPLHSCAIGRGHDGVTVVHEMCAILHALYAQSAPKAWGFVEAPLIVDEMEDLAHGTCVVPLRPGRRHTGCNGVVPAVVVMGNLSDWLQLEELVGRVAATRVPVLEAYAARLLRHIGRIRANLRNDFGVGYDDTDLDFWRDMYRAYGTAGDSVVSGWIMDFFLFDRMGKLVHDWEVQQGRSATAHDLIVRELQHRSAPVYPYVQSNRIPAQVATSEFFNWRCGDGGAGANNDEQLRQTTFAGIVAVKTRPLADLPSVVVTRYAWASHVSANNGDGLLPRRATVMRA